MILLEPIEGGKNHVCDQFFLYCFLNLLFIDLYHSTSSYFLEKAKLIDNLTFVRHYESFSKTKKFLHCFDKVAQNQ